MQIVEACPTHSRLLINSACGRGPEQWVYADGRALRPGVCRHCGTIAFGYLSDQTHPATVTQRWVAVEVGKLIAAASGGEQFTLEALLDGVQSAIKTGWRNCAEADRALGIAEGHFRQVLNAKWRLDFRFLIALGSHVDVEPISILRGQLQTASVRIEPIVVDRKGRRIAKRRVDIERLLLVILDESPDISFTALAEKLGVSRKKLIHLFPELVCDLRERRLAQVRRQKWLWLLRIGRNLRVLKAQLEQEKLVFNPLNVFNRGKIMIRKGEPEERLFLWIKERALA